MAGQPPMRVGLVIGQLGYGGAEGQLYELARRLHPAHDVVVYVLSETVDPYGPMLESLGVEVQTLPARVAFDPFRVFSLARRLRRDRIDLVHAFLFIAGAYAYLATRLTTGVRLVASARNCKPESSWLRRKLMRRAFAHADAVICNSAAAARYAIDYYRASASRTTVVYNGVDTDRFAPSSAGRSSAHDHPLRVGTIGRIERQKNLDMFLKAAACVRNARKETRFVVAGTGSERARLEALATALGLDDVLTFCGTTSDVPELLRSLDQFWLTSDWEGTPNVVLEAMATALPVIATRSGGTQEVVEDGATGVLVDVGDADGVCRAALRFAEQPREAQRTGDRARDRVREQFSLERMVEETLAVYARVAEPVP